MTLPQTLDQWTIESVLQVLAMGYYESENFDFKESLPFKKDERGKERMFATCCALANSSGGFLIFGVSDRRSDPLEQRLVGVAPSLDFPEHFGSYPNQCEPGLVWQFRNPPLTLKSGNYVQVIHIPRSWTAPHSFRQPNGARRFMKRTNKGNEDMSYDEIRSSFLQYYEKRLKLQLLASELRTMKEIAKGAIVPASAQNRQIGHGEFGLSIVETVLTDSYSILAAHPDILDALTRIRLACRDVNQQMQKMLATGYAMLGDMDKVRLDHNLIVTDRCKQIERDCDLVLVGIRALTEGV
jgi:hypothetical protein